MDKRLQNDFLSCVCSRYLMRKTMLVLLENKRKIITSMSFRLVSMSLRVILVLEKRWSWVWHKYLFTDEYLLWIFYRFHEYFYKYSTDFMTWVFLWISWHNYDSGKLRSCELELNRWKRQWGERRWYDRDNHVVIRWCDSDIDGHK